MVAGPFIFSLDEGRKSFITRCVSEGYRLTSLAYAAGYGDAFLAPSEKMNGPAMLSPDGNFAKIAIAVALLFRNC